MTRPHKAYTYVCGIFSPSLHDPALQPKGKKNLEGSRYRCPRCDTTFRRCCGVKYHFPRCIATNGNPDSLRWFDHASNGSPSKRNKTALKATVDSSNRNRIKFSIDSVMEDELEAVTAASKVRKWAAMAAEKQAANVASTFNNPNGAEPFNTHDSINGTASNVDTSNNNDTPVANLRATTSTATLEQGRPHGISAARDESATPARKQQQSESPKRGKRRGPTHDSSTAHLFNNAGLLMPVSPFQIHFFLFGTFLRDGIRVEKHCTIHQLLCSLYMFGFTPFYLKLGMLTQYL